MRVSLLVSIFLISGCATMPPARDEATPNSLYRGVDRKHLRRPIRSFRSSRLRLPVPPSNIGYLYREPMGWQSGPRGIVLKNDTNLHARCWLDGRVIQFVAYGRVQSAPVTTRGGADVVSMMTPGQRSFHIVNAGQHELRCEFHAGPAPLQVVSEGRDTFNSSKLFSHEYDLSYTRPDAVTRIYAE